VDKGTADRACPLIHRPDDGGPAGAGNAKICGNVTPSVTRSFEATRQQPLKVGDRARAKTTHRTGTVVDVTTDGGGHQQYDLSYDEGLQDHFLTTAGKDGTQVPADLIEPVEEGLARQ
jgi:hypothetical protein